MKISWVLADSAQLDPTIDISELKNIGPCWGGWQTWRSWSTDNVICHDQSQARNLISKNFHTRCNLFLQASVYQELDRPAGVKLYQGEFHQEVDHPDDIISMHLAAGNSDIVLLVGFDLQIRNLDHDKLAKHKWHNYTQYVLHMFNGNPNIQWVLLDHSNNIDKQLKKVPNLQFDTLENVLVQFK